MKIRNGAFAREWAAEQEAGCATLIALQKAARRLPLHELEHEQRRTVGYNPPLQLGD